MGWKDWTERSKSIILFMWIPFAVISIVIIGHLAICGLILANTPYKCDWNGNNLTNLMQGFYGSLLGGILTTCGLWWVTREQINAQERSANLRRKLEKLYGPLMLLIKNSDKLGTKKGLTTRTIFFTKDEAKLIDNVLQKALYLADEELIDDLIELYNVHRFQPKSDPEFIEKIINKIERRYEEIRAELGLRNKAPALAQQRPIEVATKKGTFDEVTRQIFSNQWLALGIASTFGAIFGYNLEHLGEPIDGWRIGTSAAIMLGTYMVTILLLKAYFWIVSKRN